jgi:hypothetical protein
MAFISSLDEVGNFEHICMVVSSDIPMAEPVASIGNDYNIVELS